jgi:hypothetical protein
VLSETFLKFQQNKSNKVVCESWSIC